MFPISRILLPMDFSDRCLVMLPYVQAFAARYNAELILLHVENDNELAKAGRDQLQEFDVRRVLYDGDPADAIAGFVKSEKIDLIAMPTHGYGTFRRFLIGSVTAKVLHDVTCPVLTGVHMEEAACRKPCEVLKYPLCNRSWPTKRGRSQMGISTCGRLPSPIRRCACRATAQPRIGTSILGQLAGGSCEHGAEGHRDAARRDQARRGCHSHPGRRSGKGGVLLRKEVGADLLVIGRGPRDRMDGRLTTHAYAIIRQSPCPVLSI